jgi:hypothetical protein
MLSCGCQVTLLPVAGVAMIASPTPAGWTSVRVVKTIVAVVGHPEQIEPLLDVVWALFMMRSNA